MLCPECHGTYVNKSPPVSGGSHLGSRQPEQQHQSTHRPQDHDLSQACLRSAMPSPNGHFPAPTYRPLTRQLTGPGETSRPSPSDHSPAPAGPIQPPIRLQGNQTWRVITSSDSSAQYHSHSRVDKSRDMPLPPFPDPTVTGPSRPPRCGLLAAAVRRLTRPGPSST